MPAAVDEAALGVLTSNRPCHLWPGPLLRDLFPRLMVGMHQDSASLDIRWCEKALARRWPCCWKHSLVKQTVVSVSVSLSVSSLSFPKREETLLLLLLLLFAVAVFKEREGTLFLAVLRIRTLALWIEKMTTTRVATIIAMIDTALLFAMVHFVCRNGMTFW